MKRHQGFSIFKRLFVRRLADARPPEPIGDADPPGPMPPQGAHARLGGISLEQAYRDLLLENQMLAESNEHLHERLSRRERGLEESPAARQLIDAQRKLLAERSRRLRELEFESKRLKRERNRLVEENRRLAASLTRHMQDMQPLLRKQEDSRRELEEVKAALRDKTTELLRLTDKYYQLEARSDPQTPPSSAANGRY